MKRTIEAALCYVLVIALGICVLLTNAHISISGTIYQWKDEQGVLHLTDDITKVPEGVESSMVDIEEDHEREELEEQVETAPVRKQADRLELESEAKEREIEQYWKGRALEIQELEDGLKRINSNLNNNWQREKEEVDWLLINGYSADFSIRELRRIEDELSGLKPKFQEIEKLREKLEDEARRAGVPPGYIRP